MRDKSNVEQEVDFAVNFSVRWKMLFLVRSPFVYPIGGLMLATIVKLDLIAINENCARLIIFFNTYR